MARNGVFNISPDQSTSRLEGSNPSGVVSSVNPNALKIGVLVANPTTGNGAWPMADLVKMSDGWVDNGGTGTYTITPEEHVTIDGTAELTRVICYDYLQTFPKLGTYTVFKTGTAEVAILAGGVNTGFQSASSFTFTTSPGQSISAYVRSGDGSSATLTGLSIVHSDDLAAFQADSDALAGDWLAYIRDEMASPIVRNLLAHEVYEDEFSNRTTSQSLSYANTRDRQTNLANDAGTKVSTFSLEIQVSMVNQIGADTFYWNIPPHASNNWVLQAAQLIHANLNPGIRVAIALTNESWNTAFWYNAQVIRTWQIAKTVFSTTPGTNTWVSANHGFNNGDILASIVSPNSARLAVQGPYHASGQPWPEPVLTRIQVTNATTNTIDLVLQSDGTTPFIAPEGVTEVYAWLETAFDLDGANFDTQVDNAHGIRSAQVFDVAVPVFTAGGRESVRVIETQSDFVSRTLQRTGVNGANGNFDVISLGLYYNAAEVWEVGDTEADMEADGLVAAEEVIQAAVVGHINAGFLPENIWSYEAGPHWIAELGSNGTLQQRQDAFVAFALTQGMANTEEYFYGRCQELGLRNMVITSPDLYVFGTSGTWGSKSELYLPDIPRTTLYKSWKGYIEPAAADVTAPTIALNGSPSVDIVVGQLSNWTDPGATWNDNVDGTGQVFLNLSGVDDSVVGSSYTGIYSITDQANNGPVTVSRTLNFIAASNITSYYHYLQHHSLWHHTLVSDPVNDFTVWADYWIGELANEAGLDYRSNGKFGQLYDAPLLPLNPQTGSPNTPDSWPSGSFESQTFDSITIMPSNINWQTQTVQQIVDHADTLLNYLATAQPNTPITVYEHWQEFSPLNPPYTEAQMLTYWDTLKNSYHPFYVNYFNGLVADNPSFTFKFIPAGIVIADMLTGVAESGIDTTAIEVINQNNSLFLDDSPHGAPSMYFLVAMVCYRVFFNQNPPLTYIPPVANIDSVIVNNYSTIVAYINARVQHYNTQLNGAVL